MEGLFRSLVGIVLSYLSKGKQYAPRKIPLLFFYRIADKGVCALDIAQCVLPSSPLPPSLHTHHWHTAFEIFHTFSSAARAREIFLSIDSRSYYT